MEALEILLFGSLAVVFYTYIGYGAVLFVVRLAKKRPEFAALEDSDLPPITHVIAAYNEESLIEEKIKNCLQLDYPAEKVTTIIVADGSTDATADLVKRYPQITLYFHPERKGKLAAVDRVMKDVITPITVFSDANSILNNEALQKLVRHFTNNRVGAVAGEKVVLNATSEDAAGAGEGLYWKYESFLKRMDYRLYSVVGAAGELFAVRTNLFETPAKGTLIEDFVVTMKIAADGYRVAYEPEAQAAELASPSIQEELKRKIRISAGGLQAVWMLRKALSPFKNPLLFFQYVSHRVLRWTLAPLALVSIMLSNYLLSSQHVFYQLLFDLQVAFYLLAVLGYVFERSRIRVKAFFIPFYFIFMNLSIFIGLYRLIRGNYSAIWEKAQRRAASL